MSGRCAMQRVIGRLLAVGFVLFLVVGCGSKDGNEEGTEDDDVVQPQNVVCWEKTFGGSGSDQASSIQPTVDGGYIVAGDTDSRGEGDSDAWVLKLDANGSLEWDATFGGIDEDKASSIQPTADGGYVVAGDTSSKGAGNSDAWILKLDIDGSLEWDETFGGDEYDEANSIQQTRDLGYVVAGGTKSNGAGSKDGWVFKLNANGNTDWERTYGGEDYDSVESIQQTEDLGYVVAGVTYSDSAGSGDAWIIKLDAGGSIEWEKTDGGDGYDSANSIQQTTDGGYIVAASNDMGPSYKKNNAWIIKLDRDGNKEWDKIIGKIEYTEYAVSIQQTKDLDYIVVGVTNSKGAGKSDAWLLRFDQNGVLLWNRTYGRSDSDEANSIQQTTDLGFVVAGGTMLDGPGPFDAWILKLDANGNSKCE